MSESLPDQARMSRENRPLLRRLDHVAIAVRDTERALRYFSERLGLPVAHRDELETPPVTLVYLDAGNLYLQLVSPRSECELSRWLDDNGEGLHHLCFAVDDVSAAIVSLSSGSAPLPELGTGRGRTSGFVRDGSPFGVLLECTEFRLGDGPARGDVRLVR
jgi:methylmalonyl-CoA/ethylmalonyl-CoA epimerase